MTDKQHILNFFSQYIEREIGIVYTETNYFQLEHRLDSIASNLGYPDLETLHREASTNISPSLKKLLLDLATNNETSFFRDSHVFDTIKSKVIPDIVNSLRLKRPIFIWSVAGSTGQEAYSTIISIEEGKKSTYPTLDYSLFITDFSERVLQKAKAGTYSQLEVQRGMPSHFLSQYFDVSQVDGTEKWTFKTNLRPPMKFQQLNLLDPFPNLGPFDLILCRNVLIYQSIEKKKEVVEKIDKVLSPQGFLFLGAAESLIGVSSSFNQIEFDGTVYYQKK